MDLEIKKILEKERCNNNYIYAHKLESHLRVYEMSAYLLIKLIKSYSKFFDPNQIRQIKGLLYIDIDLPYFNKICKRIELVQDNGSFLQYSVPCVSKEEYQLWIYNCQFENNLSQETSISSLNKEQQNEEEYNPSVLDLETLVREINSFQIELKTPIECMNWISQIKKMIANQLERDSR